MRTWTLLAFLTFVLSCSTVKKPTDFVVFDDTGEIPISGDAFDGSPSPDGRWIAYVRDEAQLHTSPQIWMQSLRTGEEKRLTFQTGELRFPVFSRDGRFVYFFSDTDEAKDNPMELVRAINPKSPSLTPFQHPKYQLVPGDVYRLNLFTNAVERLTRERGFQGLAVPNHKNDGFWYISKTDGPSELVYYDLKRRWAKRVRKTENMVLDPSLSPDGQLLTWTELTTDGLSSRIFVGDASFKQIQELALPEGLMVSPIFAPNNVDLIFSAKWKEQKQFDLFIFRRNDRCLYPVTNTPQDESWPQIIPRSDKILFSRYDGTRAKIFQQVMGPAQACLEYPGRNP